MKTVKSILLSIISLITFLYFSSPSYAQTGPGGVGSFSDNVVWLNGDVLTFSTAPSISAWPDQSGNGNDFNQATASKQPVRVTYGGFDAVRFDGVNDWVRSGAIAALNSGDHTHFAVYNGNKANHAGILFEGSFTQSNQFIRTFRTNAGNVKAWVLDNGLGIVSNETANSGSFQIIHNAWDKTADTYTMYKDGSFIGTQAGANGSPSGNSANTVGAQINGGRPFNGDMGELIVYNKILNTAEKNIVENYLSTKYNVAITTDLYSHDATHRREVFGIGQEADGNNLTAQGSGIVEISIGSLANGEYILSGHDNASVSGTTNNVPAAIAGGSRINRVWRTDITGAPGAVDLVFDNSSLSLATGSYYLLIDSDDGDFTNATAIGPVVEVGNLVTFSGVSLSDGDYYTIASGTATAIESVKSGFWDVASTWSCSCVPGASDDALINAGHNISTRVTTNVNNLDVEGSLDATAADFFVKGDLTFTSNGVGDFKEINFDGSAAQTLTNTTANTIDIVSLKLDNANGLSLVSGATDIKNATFATTGTITNVSSSITLLSTSSQTAVMFGSGGYAGNFILQRFISARNGNWGDLSAPVSGLTLGQWDSDQTGTINEIYMSGVNGLNGNANQFKSVWDWNEATQAYDSISDTNYVMPVGMGIEIYLADTLGTWDAKTIDSRGTPNFGSIPVSVVTDWNLVGNPYQAWIKWTNLTKPTLNSTYYIYNTNTGNYDAKTGGSIPPHQGFWVESTSAGTLTFTESSKTSSGSSTFWKNGEPMEENDEPYVFTEVALKVSSAINTFSHELKIRLNNLATEGHDYFDASFLKSRIIEAPSITSFPNNSNKELAINSFNYQDEMVMPIKVKVGVTGLYTIEPINFSELSSDYQVMELKDKQTGRVYDLNDLYRTGIKVEVDANDDSERFELRLSNTTTLVSELENSGINVYKSTEYTVIEFDNTEINYVISVYNSIGQQVIESINSIGENKLIINNSKLPVGVNIINVSFHKENFTKKLTY